jgi:putative flavoprotein involved in K+ transport
MSKSLIDVAVIGAGHAGLSISYCLKQNEIKHLVFERGRIGETWRSQRWDSFVMNTANKNNVLPGTTYSGSDPEGFCTSTEFVSLLESYSLNHNLPVLEQTRVISVEKPNEEKYFRVSVSENGTIKNYQSRQVIVTSGGQNAKKVPSFAKNISSDILQLHTADYRSASQLPEGAVLVIGSAQSGCQIAEDLISAGRKVYLSSSMVARIPRRYRGKDIIDWLLMTDFFNLRTEAVTDPKIIGMRVPLLSGIGELGHTLSLQLIAGTGGTILGKAENADENYVYLADNAREHIKFADGFSQKVKDMVDEFILKNQMSALQPEEDIADMPDRDASCASTITSLNFKEHNIKSIIWATGFNSDFSYLKLPVFDNDRNPKHKNGLSDFKGLYFLGLPWLRMRKSAMIFGINDDATFIADAVLSNHIA